MYVMSFFAAVAMNVVGEPRPVVWTTQPTPVPGVDGFPFVKVCVETPGSSSAIVAFTYAENWSKILAAAGSPPPVDPILGPHAAPPAGIKLGLNPPCVVQETDVVVYWLQQPTYYFADSMELIENSPLNSECWEFIGWSY